ncbi:hypothetical protein [Streptomyces sp. NPDC003032]
MRVMICRYAAELHAANTAPAPSPELFWWYRLGSTWDLIPAYRTARGLTGQGA